MEAEPAPASERRTEIADLTRRVVTGTMLTAPVLFAVMAQRAGCPACCSTTGCSYMNSLITLGTVAAYGYSLLVTLAPQLLAAEVREVHFKAIGANILTLIMLGRLLEARAKAGTGEAVRALLGLQARAAHVLRDDTEAESPSTRLWSATRS